jgi:hypothetical protein
MMTSRATKTLGGRVPAGIWRLNVERSKTLSPKSMTLWIIKNSGDELTWVAVETNPEQQIQVVSWSGRYGGPPATVVGAGIEARLTSSPDEGIRTEGEFPGLGPFVEVCTLTDDGQRMICKGQVTTPQGVQSYYEDFEWLGESPHHAGPAKT